MLSKTKAPPRQWLETGTQESGRDTLREPIYAVILPLYVTGRVFGQVVCFPQCHVLNLWARTRTLGSAPQASFLFLCHTFFLLLLVFLYFFSFYFQHNFNCHRLDKMKTVLRGSLWSSHHNTLKEIPSFNSVPLSDLLIVTTFPSPLGSKFVSHFWIQLVSHLPHLNKCSSLMNSTSQCVFLCLLSEC